MTPIILPGSASRDLVDEICAPIGFLPADLEVKRFSDGETRVKINENVRGRDVYIVQSTHAPVNDNLMELLLLIDAAKRASADRVNAVVPYFGYARQDRKDEGRVALSAKLVANLISVAGADRVIALDLHSGQIQGFFDIPVDHLYAGPLLAEFVREMELGDCVVVSPDLGSVKRARGFAERLGAPMAIVDKRRQRANEAEVMNIIGDVRGAKVIMFDDMIDTAGTICSAAEALLAKGATAIYACCTHAVFSGQAVERLAASPLKELIVTNTIPQARHGGPLAGKLRVVSIAPLIGEAIRRIHNHQSVSSLFS
ncbi:MAG: ribose-phosphate pyrophosphokinase [Candidatus Sumerlaeota bacterium]|nr:ribose-phosphate pyrophosphokinase [Candidatus Sumerlaeota bacterium]